MKLTVAALTLIVVSLAIGMEKWTVLDERGQHRMHDCGHPIIHWTSPDLMPNSNQAEIVNFLSREDMNHMPEGVEIKIEAINRLVHDRRYMAIPAIIGCLSDHRVSTKTKRCVSAHATDALTKLTGVTKNLNAWQWYMWWLERADSSVLARMSMVAAYIAEVEIVKIAPNEFAKLGDKSNPQFVLAKVITPIKGMKQEEWTQFLINDNMQTGVSIGDRRLVFLHDKTGVRAAVASDVGQLPVFSPVDSLCGLLQSRPELIKDVLKLMDQPWGN